MEGRRLNQPIDCSKGMHCSLSSRLYGCIYITVAIVRNPTAHDGQGELILDSCITVRHVTASRPLLLAWVDELSGANWRCKCHCYYFARGSDCKVLWWVCLSVCECVCVCLSVRADISGTIRTIFTKFLCMLPLSVAWSSSGMLTIGHIACRWEGGDGSAQCGRSVIYDCLVFFVLW